MPFSEKWIDVREKFFIIAKRGWVLITFLVIVITVVAIGTFTATPLYRASARIIIEPLMPKVMPFEELFSIAGKQMDYYNTQYKILKSYSLAQMVVEDLTKQRYRKKLSSQQMAFVKPETLLGMVEIKPIAQSFAVDIQVVCPDPKLAAEISNTWSEQYVRHEIMAKVDVSRQALSQLSRQLKDQSEKVRRSQIVLQEYKEKEAIASVESQQSAFEKELAELSSVYVQARREKIIKEIELTQLEKYSGGDISVAGLPAIQNNLLIQRLKIQLVSLQGTLSEYSQRYKAKHPKMLQLQAEIEAAQQSLREEINKIIEALRKEYEMAKANEDRIKREIDDLKAESLRLDRKRIQYRTLQADVESNQKVYEALLERVNEASMSGQVEVTNIRILDYAKVPNFPFKPRRTFNLLMGLVVGAVGGVALVFLIENLDDTLKTPAEAKSVMDLPLLGVVPRYDQTNLPVGAPLPILQKSVGAISEAFRSIRTAIYFSSLDKSPQVILVTSPLPREGKTDVASQLAVILAQQGEKVLLVDSDMRKPRLHKIFGMEKSNAGLSNLLVGEVNLEEVVRPTEVPFLGVLTCGSIPPNPAELLNSQRFKDVVAQARNKWARIILDSPPLMSVTDAAILGRIADGTIEVVRAGHTSWKKAVYGRDQLRAVQANILGMVLNGVDVNRGDYYYYYRSYYY